MENLKQELDRIGSSLRSSGIYCRLIMSDDIFNLRVIRERAVCKAPVETLPESEGFWNGIAVSESVQEWIDDLVRQRKPELLSIITDDPVGLVEANIRVIRDHELKSYLVIFNHCNSGFYISERDSVPRHERRQRVKSNKMNQGLPLTKEVPVVDGEASGTRRKFTVIRKIVN